MHRLYVLDFGGSWEQELSLVDFVYNSNHQAIIGMALYDALCVRKCWSPMYWDDIGKRKTVNLDFIEDITEKVLSVRQQLFAVQSREKSFANLCRRELGFEVRDHVVADFADESSQTVLVQNQKSLSIQHKQKLLSHRKGFVILFLKLLLLVVAKYSFWDNNNEKPPSLLARLNQHLHKK